MQSTRSSNSIKQMSLVDQAELRAQFLDCKEEKKMRSTSISSFTTRVSIDDKVYKKADETQKKRFRQKCGLPKAPKARAFDHNGNPKLKPDTLDEVNAFYAQRMGPKHVDNQFKPRYDMNELQDMIKPETTKYTEIKFAQVKDRRCQSASRQHASYQEQSGLWVHLQG